MYKRKIMGILKYGTEDTPAKNTGFSRRTVAFKSLRLERRSYELMLLQQKAAQTTAVRASGRKAASSSSGNKIDTFLGLKAGYRY
jgi:hypothetical protein